MSPITEFYRGRTILVTGGTGFMGKVLLEKLLRSLPEIKQIYVLLRSKDKSTSERMQCMISKPPFTLQNLGKEDFQKLVGVNGDINKKGLGLSDEDRSKLINDVSIVFHLAATLRMNANLKEAVEHNTISTLRLLNLCSEMKNLESFIYASTAYCNADVDYMQEKIYKPYVDPFKVIDFIQWIDEDSLNRIQDTIIKPHPNTYTFSKRLAETIISDKYKDLPISICRPSMVMACLKEPSPGFVDSLNGPIGLILAGGKGVIRSIIMDTQSVPQVIPVDVAINGMIVCGWYRTTKKFREIPVYNLTQSSNFAWGNLVDFVRRNAIKYPYKHFFWYPVCKGRRTRWYHNIIVLIFHLMPAYVIDFLLILFMQKPYMVRLQKKLITVMKLFEPFTVRNWKFSNHEFMKIKAILSPQDLETFYFMDDGFKMDEYLKDNLFGARRFCINESSHRSYGRVILNIMLCVEYLGRGLIGYVAIWLTLYVLDATQLLSLKYWRNGIHLVNQVPYESR